MPLNNYPGLCRADWVRLASPMASTTRHSIHSQRGLSLVELMVAMAISLVLMTVLATVFANSSRSQKEITMAAQQVENGRYSIEILSDDLRHAGYYGYYTASGTAPVALPDPCSNDTTIIKNALLLPVQGYNSLAAINATLPCIADANFVAGTDVLVVRHASTEVTASGSLVALKVYIQAKPSATSSSSNLVVDLGVAASFATMQVRDGSGANVAAPIRQLKTHIYFIAPCSAATGGSDVVDNPICTSSDDGGSPIPTLKRLELTSASGVTKFKIYPLVEGIQNFQVEYGIDSDNDGAPNGAYVTAPPTVADWKNVMAMRLYVLARNTQISSGYTDTKTYNLGSTAVAGSGNYRRHVYDTLVRLKNPSERREPST